MLGTGGGGCRGMWGGGCEGYRERDCSRMQEVCDVGHRGRGL